MEIPVINIAKILSLRSENESNIGYSDSVKVGEKLVKSFSTHGFALVENHGIPKENIDEIRSLSYKFFACDLDYKMKFLSKSGTTLCYDPVGSQFATPGRPFDYHECFRVPSCAYDCDWPNIKELKTKCQQFEKVCNKLLLRLLTSIGQGMGLKDSQLFLRYHKKIGHSTNTTRLKFVHYPPIPDDVVIQEYQLRVGEHTDIGSLTILFPDGVGGLQIKRRDGSFMDVPYIPGTAIVNVGDMLQYCSGKRLKSTVHRVVIPEETTNRAISKLTVGYFGCMDNEAELRKVEFNDAELDSETTKSMDFIKAGDFFNKRFNGFVNYE
ncbi:uncharacterized protein LOC120329883 [Styela clava]